MRPALPVQGWRGPPQLAPDSAGPHTPSEQKGLRPTCRWAWLRPRLAPCAVPSQGHFGPCLGAPQRPGGWSPRALAVPAGTVVLGPEPGRAPGPAITISNPPPSGVILPILPPRGFPGSQRRVLGPLGRRLPVCLSIRMKFAVNEAGDHAGGCPVVGQLGDGTQHGTLRLCRTWAKQQRRKDGNEEGRRWGASAGTPQTVSAARPGTWPGGRDAREPLGPLQVTGR